MADDIVAQLQWLRNEFYNVDGVTAIVEVAVDKIERLQAAGDALVRLMDGSNSTWVADTEWDAAVTAWKEARRG